LKKDLLRGNWSLLPSFHRFLCKQTSRGGPGRGKAFILFVCGGSKPPRSIKRLCKLHGGVGQGNKGGNMDNFVFAAMVILPFASVMYFKWLRNLPDDRKGFPRSRRRK